MKMNAKSLITSTSAKAHIFRVAIVGLTVLASVLAMSGVAAADGVDVDQDGYFNAIVREYSPQYPLLFKYPNVGASCSSYFPNTVGGSSVVTTVNVRPPEVWAMNGYTSQQVYWRPVLWNVYTRSWYYLNNSVSATVSPGHPTEFGGGGDGYTANTATGGMAAVPHYYDGSIPLTVNGSGWVPYAQVTWQAANGSSAANAILRIHWTLGLNSYLQDTPC
jgi:hypothetical protein